MMFKTVNSMGISPFIKNNPLSFEGRGHITLVKEELTQDSFQKSEDDTNPLQRLINAGRVLMDGTKFFFVKKVTIEGGNEEIPDDINYPDAEIKMTGGEVKTIKGSSVELKNEAKVENIEAGKLSMFNNAEVTCTACTSEIIKMFDEAKIREVKHPPRYTPLLVMYNQAEVTENAGAEEIIMSNEAKIKNARADYITMENNAEIKGTAKVTGTMDMNDYAKANNVEATKLTMQDCSDITGIVRASVVSDDRDIKWKEDHQLKII